ncbi:MAG: flagellar protein FlgN [Dehalococcoidia bacterium]|nr:flagellar protein FlgN [Dehalococcoidia bacterium]
MIQLLDGVAALTSALEQQRDTMVSMLDLARREERAIVGGDVEALTKLTDEREGLLELMAALESERMTALVAIGGSVGLPPASLTLTQVAEAAGPAGASLTSVGMELRQRATAARDANARNALLLRTSRDIVDRWLQYLRSMMTSVLYDAGGRTAEAGRRPQLDRSA